MNNLKAVLALLCALCIMGGVAVWWVESKIAQVTGVVNGAVDSVQETVNVPVTAVKSASTSLAEGAEAVMDPLCRGSADLIEIMFGLERKDNWKR